MKNISLALLRTFVLLAGLMVWQAKTAEAHGLKVSVEAPQPLKAVQENKFTVKIQYADGAPVTEKELDVVHTKKIHLLVVDETLSDYHHLHPVAGAEPGTFKTSFVPAKEGNYKAWIDITVSGDHQFIAVDLKGAKPCAANCIDKKVSDTGTANGLKASISFDDPPKSGEATMAMVDITDEKGKPVTDLEPVMGAFSHVVGFYDDFQSVVHVHPMGEEPTSSKQRGGPELSFHIEPEKSGYLKLYVQLRRKGQDIFIPLGLMVQ